LERIPASRRPKLLFQHNPPCRRWQRRLTKRSNNYNSGVHPAAFLRVLGTLSSALKRLVRKADHSPPSSAQICMPEAIPPHLYTYLWLICLIKPKNNFTDTGEELIRNVYLWLLCLIDILLSTIGETIYNKSGNNINSCLLYTQKYW
jgi:hypothetical protein